MYFLFSAFKKDHFSELPPTAGWITPPDYDEDGFYDFNLNCLYAVQGMDNEVIEFQVMYIDLEFSNGCQYDYLRVSIYFDNKPLLYLHM